LTQVFEALASVSQYFGKKRVRVKHFLLSAQLNEEPETLPTEKNINV
jgi:hypothetical protein